MFGSDDPRGGANYLWVWRFPAPDSLAVAPTLAVSFILAHRRLPISSLSFPSRPLPRLLTAPLAAIALAHLPGMKALPAPFEQTTPCAPLAGSSFPPTRLLIFGMACWILGRAHGRSRLPEAPALEGKLLLSGAKQRLRVTSISRGFLDVIDDNKFAGTPSRLEFQPKLLL
jgi:hypothetical protein